MKKVIFLTMLSFLFTVSVMGEKSMDQDAEKAAIKKVILDYIEGWFEGNTERMDRALHTDLSKKGLVKLPMNGRSLLNYASKSNMMEYTNAGLGKNVPKDKRNVDIVIFEIYNGIATAKALSTPFMDYMHLAKYNNEWKIINVLWIPNESRKPAGPPKNEKDTQ